VSVQTLANSPDAQAEITAQVRSNPTGRDLPADFVPKKVVFWRRSRAAGRSRSYGPPQAIAPQTIPH
jgi:hypothetical protein